MGFPKVGGLWVDFVSCLLDWLVICCFEIAWFLGFGDFVLRWGLGCNKTELRGILVLFGNFFV